MSTRIGFAVDSRGTVYELAFSDAVSRAYDIMVAGRVPAQTAADMALAAERNGKDPVAFAEHFVRQRRSLREPELSGLQLPGTGTLRAVSEITDAVIEEASRLIGQADVPDFGPLPAPPPELFGPVPERIEVTYLTAGGPPS